MPDLAVWQWLLGLFCALMVGVAKTGMPGGAILVPALMVLTVGDARYAAAWLAPILSTGDIFAVVYWRRHADARKLLSLIPWVVLGMAGGAFALSLSEHLLRRIIGVIVLLMLAVSILRRRNPSGDVGAAAWLFGIAAGFATTVANAAAPVMNMYLLSRRLPKEQFIATGAWFFFVVNLTKVPIYAGYGLFSRSSITFDLLMAPAVICGAFLGFWLIRRLPQRLFEILIITLTAFASVFLFT